MLGSKDMRAKYIATVLTDSQRLFIWEYFRPGTIPLTGDRGYYDKVTQINLVDVRGVVLTPPRNEEDHFNPSLFFALSPSIIPPMGSKQVFPPQILVRDFAQSVPWLLPPQQ